MIYKRHGTTSLFATLDVATGAVIGQCMKRHRHQAFLRFLRTITMPTPSPSSGPNRRKKSSQKSPVREMHSLPGIER